MWRETQGIRSFFFCCVIRVFLAVLWLTPGLIFGGSHHPASRFENFAMICWLSASLPVRLGEMPGSAPAVGKGRNVSLKLFMEVIAMKNRIIAVAVVLVALTVAWSVFATEESAERPRRGGFGNMSAEERTAMRERFQNMSEEERQKYREQMRARFENMSEEERAAMRRRSGGRTRLSREDQLKAIAAMQEQLAKLKAGIESSTPRTGTNFRDLSEEERTKLREQMTKARTDREAAVTALRAELDKLSPPRATPEQMETLRELRAISELATKEKAVETTKRLAALIQKQAQQMSSLRGGRRPGTTGEGGQRGAGTGASRRPAREGGGTQ